MPSHDLNTLAARRLALRAHGVTDPRPSGRVDRRHLRRVLDQIGLLQIDSVNVVSRSHYLPVFTRLGPYDHTVLDRAAADRELMEAWVHEATYLPARDHHLFEWRRRDARDFKGRNKRTAAWVAQKADLIDHVLDEIRRRGPLAASDFDEHNEKRGPWWGWGDAKMAVEWLFRIGEVGAIRGPNFERRYDVMDRVLPSEFQQITPPGRDDAHRQLLMKAAGHLGIATVDELADYHRLQITESRGHVHDLVADGELLELSVEGWDKPGYVRADWSRARRDSISALMSPFDPIAWHRDRAERIFGFRYRIEIYVPKPKRVYGYYVLPFVHRNGLLARVDVKHDRKESVLRVPAAWGEAHDDDPVDTASALAAELVELATFLGAGGVDVADRGDLSAELRRHLP